MSIQSDVDNPEKDNSILIPPIFGYEKIGNLTFNDILFEWINSINFFSNRHRLFSALNIISNLISLIAFIIYLNFYLSLATALFVLVSSFYIVNVYNTFWYHRYCSHFSFKFKKNWYANFLLWTNPFIFREEAYAIPHQIHHQKAEKKDDPYGPHFGWVGNFLAIETSQKINTNISKEEYEALINRVRHINFKINSYNEFRVSGNIENVYYYFLRIIFSQLFYFSIFFSLGGFRLVTAWQSAIFLVVFLIRDFNWRGHGGNYRKHKIKDWEFDNNSNALNQHFYGYFVSEWHNNHHKYPYSANNALLPNQLDFVFLLIRFLKKVGVVESYVNAADRFANEIKSINKEAIQC